MPHLEMLGAGQQVNTCKVLRPMRSLPVPCPHTACRTLLFLEAKHQLNSMVFMQQDTAADFSFLPSREKRVNVASEQVCEVIRYY